MADLMSGLMAGANFATGYQQGQQTNIQNTAYNKMNQLSLEDAQLKMDQERLSLKQQQVLSDKAMQLFNPTTPGNGQPTPGDVPQATMPGGNQPLAATGQAVDNGDPSDKMDQLAQTAAGSGDLTHANQLWTNAANLRNAKFEQAQKQSAMQTAELKRQQMHYTLASQYAGTVDDSESGFNQWKMAMLSDPNSSQGERQNIANMNYRTGIMGQIRDSGMNASQQAAIKLRQEQFTEQQRVNDLQEAHRDRQDTEKAAHDRALEASKVTQAKVGAAAKASTANDLAAATAATKEAMGGDTVDTKDPGFMRARENVSARALQIVRDNRAVTYPQAVTMAAAEAKRNGEFQDITTADTHSKIFGLRVPFTGDDASTKPGYREQGSTPETAIHFTGQAKSELIPGKFYQTGNGLMQWTGTGWKPQS